MTEYSLTIAGAFLARVGRAALAFIEAVLGILQNSSHGLTATAMEKLTDAYIDRKKLCSAADSLLYATRAAVVVATGLLQDLDQTQPRSQGCDSSADTFVRTVQLPTVLPRVTSVDWLRLVALSAADHSFTQQHWTLAA